MKRGLRLLLLIWSVALVASTMGETTSKTKKTSCQSCHSDMFKTQDNHFISTADDCRFCHDVTGSGSKHEVSTIENNSACVACHPQQDRLNTSDTHADMLCADCHAVHGSEITSQLIRPVVQLCSASCHTTHELGRSHPLGQQITDNRTGGELTCISTCHSLHKPKDKKLLQIAATHLCSACHTSK